MREISCRAWDKRKKEMVYEEHFGDAKDETEGFTKLVIDGGDVFEVNLFANGDCEYIAIDAEIMQFTGLLDKNGKEIFEGDIAKRSWNFKLPSGFRRKGSEVGQVSFNEKTALWKFVVNPVCTESLWVANQNNKNYSFEKIGTIYENPEPCK